MNPRFDLPPEVMLGERVVKPVPVPAKPEDRWLPLAENKDVQVNGSGQMRTNVPLPAVSFADLAMLAADRGPENEEDDPVDETDVKCAMPFKFSDPAGAKIMADAVRVMEDTLREMCGLPQVMLGGRQVGKTAMQALLEQTYEDRKNAQVAEQLNRINTWGTTQTRAQVDIQAQLDLWAFAPRHYSLTAPSDAEAKDYFKRCALGHVKSEERTAFERRLRLRKSVTNEQAQHNLTQAVQPLMAERNDAIGIGSTLGCMCDSCLQFRKLGR